VTLETPPDVTFTQAVTAVQRLGWGLVESDQRNRHLRARTSVGLRSFGETITAEVRARPTGSEIWVSSRCNMQLISWGKNQENVTLLIRELQHQVTDLQPEERKPMSTTTLVANKFCTACGTELEAAVRFCGRCGASLAAGTSASPAVPLPVQPLVSAPNYIGLSEYYRQEFSMIENSGERYQGKWNWAAFLFGGIWALTKGLWVPALIAFIGAIFTGGIVGVIYWFIFGARGNYMYYRKVTRNLNPAY
jgi:hypothetical protein